MDDLGTERRLAEQGGPAAEGGPVATPAPAEIDVAVVGAGQAGLSAGYFLTRAGLRSGTDFVVFDHSPGPGGAWQFRWPSLTYGKAHRVHALPGMEWAGGDPDLPSSQVVGEYFRRYEEAFDLRVLRPADVIAVREGTGGRMRVETDRGTWSARALLNATGTWDRPFLPYYPGQEGFLGRQLHTAGYRSAAEFAGLHVVVVGGGTSAVQLLMELNEPGGAARTTWVTRRPPVFRDMAFDEEWGRSVVARVDDRVRAGLPPQSVVSVTGLAATEAVLAAQARGVLRREPMFDRITPHGVAWDGGRTLDADVILWATGFRAALDHLAPLRLREAGGGVRLDGTRVVKDPRVHLLGYGPSASTIGANRAGRGAVREIRTLLAGGGGGTGAAPGRSVPAAVPLPAR
ncbi:Predicted flavoprotein CzcO associated with the cation diffusion facilitator CzcD [Actinacidiphila yanglinensis]|uniref:Predicted flavoprotein CzcO associated with the cation diffusion facilitator CzcD n=1 Tax=Actinacidiphila yanglinensis TaxID=310779 RepID=A0A1H6DWZ0_9ACTN|nr:NAD(P)-binding domain-containing protein [Actinacidiphila yanglinensis]SEG89862.1 Predicted flavoprotein CzcO associated with the cation diffusion facilitator CzcD [Actinacidiphila yanglinensis]